MTYAVNMPVRFPGSEEQRLANRATHFFVFYDHEEPARCGDCDAATYHVAADYPCGAEVPREVVTFG